MRCAKKFFFVILAMAISACQRLIYAGEVQANHLAQGAPRRVTQCLCIGHTTFQLRGGHYH